MDLFIPQLEYDLGGKFTLQVNVKMCIIPLGYLASLAFRKIPVCTCIWCALRVCVFLVFSVTDVSSKDGHTKIYPRTWSSYNMTLKLYALRESVLSP